MDGATVKRILPLLRLDAVLLDQSNVAIIGEMDELWGTSMVMREVPVRQNDPLYQILEHWSRKTLHPHGGKVAPTEAIRHRR